MYLFKSLAPSIKILITSCRCRVLRADKCGNVRRHEGEGSEAAALLRRPALGGRAQNRPQCLLHPRPHLPPGITILFTSLLINTYNTETFWSRLNNPDELGSKWYSSSNSCSSLMWFADAHCFERSTSSAFRHIYLAYPDMCMCHGCRMQKAFSSQNHTNVKWKCGLLWQR